MLTRPDSAFISKVGHVVNLVEQDTDRSMPAWHSDIKSKNGFFAVHHVKLPNIHWSFEGFLLLQQERRQIALPLQRTDTYFTLKLMPIFSNVLRQQMQLFRTAICISAKSLKCPKKRMWNISVTNGFKEFGGKNKKTTIAANKFKVV